MTLDESAAALTDYKHKVAIGLRGTYYTFSGEYYTMKQLWWNNQQVGGTTKFNGVYYKPTTLSPGYIYADSDGITYHKKFDTSYYK